MPVTFIQSGRFTSAFDPTTIAGLKLWLDASDAATITESSGAVSQWNDKSGNANHVSQATGSAQPTTGSFTQNGLNVLGFDGGDSLTGAALAVTKPATVFAVAYVVSPAGGDKVLIHNGFVNGWMVKVNASRWVYTKRAVADVTDTTDTVPGSTWFQLTITVDSSSQPGGYLDAAALTFPTNTSGITAPTTKVHVGAFDSGSQWNGRIAEMLVYDSALGTTDRTAVQSYLKSKWSTP